MATHDPKAPGRPGWAATRPFEPATPARAVPAFQPTRPAEPWQPTRPAEAWAPTRPAEPAPPARPANAWQPTRPADPWQHTGPADIPAAVRPANPWQATRPMASWPASRPMDGLGPPPRGPGAAPASGTVAPPAAPGYARARPPAAAPRPALTPPSAEGDWQLTGRPGQHLVLMPGQMHLGHQAASVRTLLGSCVAITLWHPGRRIGGMCHYLLPQRQRRPGEPADGRYGDEAVDAMVKRLLALGTQPGEYVAHLYGGADTMSGTSASRFNIGERNIEQGWSLIDRYGFQLDGVDVGEDIPRVVSLSLDTGVVQMRRGQGQAPDHLRA